MAEVKIIGGRSGTLRPWLFRTLREAQEKKNVPRVVLVPEQYTLQAERDLIAGMNLPGLLNLNVISPTKLQTMVRECAGDSGKRLLDGTGRTMAIHRALHVCEGELDYYRDVGGLFGAVPRMEQTLSELRESGLTAEKLKENAASARNGAQRARMSDLARIWQTYDMLTMRRFDDPASAWEGMCVRLGESGLWNGVSLYIYGFDMVRPDLQALILAAVSVCESVTVLLTMAEEKAPDGRIFRVQRESAYDLEEKLSLIGQDCSISYLQTGRENMPEALTFLDKALFSESAETWDRDPGPAVSLFAAANPTAEAWNAVSTLTAWHEKGMPWKRMAVALSMESAMSSALTAALRKNHIPFFYSRKDQASRHGVGRLLCAALDCVSNGFRTESLMQAALSGFGTLSREEGAVLEDYVLANGIDYGSWKQPFTRGEGAEQAEEMRIRLVSPMEKLHDALTNAPGAEAGVEAVVSFLQEENVFAQLKERHELLTADGMYAEAIVDRQFWDFLMKTLDQLQALLSGQRVSLKEIARFISGALERGRIASLPEDEEGVSVGEIGHMLPGETDALILMGMNDGVMDIPDGGLLNDAERESLRASAGVRVGLDRSRMLMLRQSDYYRTMTLPEKYLRLSYSLRDEDGRARMPGEPAAELKRIFPLMREDGGLRADGIPDRPKTLWMSVKGLGPLLQRLRGGECEDLDGEWKAALRQLWDSREEGTTVREMIRRFLPGREDGKIRSETALRLFQADRVSISRLECYAGCPCQQFIRYGLRPIIRTAWEFTAAETGTFFHAAMEKYINRAVKEKSWPALPEKRVDELMDRVLEEVTAAWDKGPLGGDAGGVWQGEEYIRRARHAAQVLTRFAENSDFRVAGTEIPFGEGDGLPPLVLTLSDGTRVALRGKIDRLDTWNAPEGRYVRILDLKSSSRELNPARMDRGEQLQLMIYLRAVQRAVPGSRAAGAMYFPIQDGDVNAGTPEEAERKRIAEIRLRGVVMAEEKVIRAMDREISPFSIGKVFNQDGSVSKNAPWALESEVLTGLMDAAVSRAEDLCDRIRSGVTSAAPSVEKEGFSACTWCEYLPVCKKRREDEVMLETGMTFRDVAEKNALRKREK